MLDSSQEAIAETGQNDSESDVTPRFRLDDTKLAEEVRAIVETDYFRNLKVRTKELRDTRKLA